MYVIKDYDNVYEYSLKDKELIGLKFPKTPKNFMFKLIKKGNEAKIYLEYEMKSAEYYKSLLAKYFGSGSLKDLLTKEFDGFDLELYGFLDKDVYIVDICINDKFIFQDHLKELSKLYNFNILEEVFREKFDADKIDEIKEPILIKAKWEDLTDNTGTYKGRYIMFKEAVVETENEKGEEDDSK